MKYSDLRDFLSQLEARGELRRIGAEVDPHLDTTEICDRTLRARGPALLFERPKHHSVPVLGNLFGTPERVALAMGADGGAWQPALREIGRLLAFLKEPEPPKGLIDLWQNTRPLFLKVMSMAPRTRGSAPCQEIVVEGADVDLARFPVQHCWPDDAGPLITWGLTITRGPLKSRQNLGIYRQQVIARNKVIMRWLAHRGGALDFRDHARTHPGTPFPIAVAIGADPATILGAVTPVPDSLSEYQFAGLLRGARTEITRCLTRTTSMSRRRRRSCSKATSRPTQTIRRATKPRRRVRTAITPAITTRSSASRCSPSRGSPPAARRSITPPTPASRRMSRRCWASR